MVTGNIDAITGYFDESCTDEGKKFSVVSGVMSPQEIWDLFQPKWAGVLDRHNVSAFHMTDFAAGYLEDKSGKLLGPNNALPLFNDLAGLLETFSIWAFSIGCDNAMIAKYGLPRSYQLCSLCCCFAIDRLANEKGIKSGIGLVFDRGNKYRHDLEEGYNEAVATGIISPHLEGTVAFGNRRNINPLQAADILAWMKGREGNGALPRWVLDAHAAIKTRLEFDVVLTEELIMRTLGKVLEKAHT